MLPKHAKYGFENHFEVLSVGKNKEIDHNPPLLWPPGNTHFSHTFAGQKITCSRLYKRQGNNNNVACGSKSIRITYHQIFQAKIWGEKRTKTGDHQEIEFLILPIDSLDHRILI